MEYRTFTYEQDSRDIQVYSLLWQHHQKSMTVKRTITETKPKEWVPYFCVYLLHSQSFMREGYRGNRFFKTQKKIAEYFMIIIYVT